MPLLISIFIMIGFTSPLAAEDLEKLKASERVFQCGALYGLLWKLHEIKPDKTAADLNELKFRRLARRAEDYYLSIGKTKAAAETDMNKHVAAIANAASSNGGVLIGFKKSCDVEFE